MIHREFTPILRDINGNILFKTNQLITRETIKQIVKDRNFDSSKVNLSDSPIADDIIHAINRGIYKIIFSQENDARQLVKIIKQTVLNAAILSELNNIKTLMPNTYSHILVVAALSIKICIDMNDDRFDPLRIASIGLVHDLGKSRLPLSILEKNSPLTDAEFKVIQEHPIIEYLLISHYLNNPKSFIALAGFAHHERLDGSGYPRGIKQLDNYIQTIIPCDVFDALTSHRPYRNEPFTVRAALDLLLAESRKGRVNKKFVKCLISYVRKDKQHYKQVKISEENRDAPPRINHYGKRKK
ncbi:MAG: HD domain-containing protein [Candidatus Omnitrophica bacterium]|nr:HD domain-containing protein [Candidatus Omnitrophota bacterium]